MQTRNEWNPYVNSIWADYLNHQKLKEKIENEYQYFICFFNEHLKDIKKKSEFMAKNNGELYLMRSFTNSIQNHHNQVSWGLYYLLCIAGGLFALCSGFDGMASVLSLVVPQLYLGFVVFLGVLSALSALGIFIARDKPAIMEGIGLSHNPYHNLVDEYIYSLQIYNSSQFQSKVQKNEQGTEFNHEKMTAEILNRIFENKKTLNIQVINSWFVQIKANVVMLIGGVLFFSDGFFVGENVAMFLGTLLSTNSFGLTLGISLVMGLFALAAYWYVERSSLRDYLYDNVSTDECLRKDAAEINTKNLSLLGFFDKQLAHQSRAEEFSHDLVCA
jgi:hypothetical protein